MTLKSHAVLVCGYCSGIDLASKIRRKGMSDFSCTAVVVVTDSYFSGCRNANFMQILERDESYFAHRSANIVMIMHAAIGDLKKGYHLPFGSLTLF